MTSALDSALHGLERVPRKGNEASSGVLIHKNSAGVRCEDSDSALISTPLSSLGDVLGHLTSGGGKTVLGAVMLGCWNGIIFIEKERMFFERRVYTRRCKYHVVISTCHFYSI